MLLSELYRFQNARSKDKKKRKSFCLSAVMCRDYIAMSLFWDVTWRTFVLVRRRFGTISKPFSSDNQPKKNECLTLKREGTMTLRTPGTPPPKHGVKSQKIRTLIAELPRDKSIWKPSCFPLCFCHSCLCATHSHFQIILFVQVTSWCSGTNGVASVCSMLPTSQHDRL